jgi:hypothetical protein
MCHRLAQLSLSRLRVPVCSPLCIFVTEEMDAHEASVGQVKATLDAQVAELQALCFSSEKYFDIVFLVSPRFS